MAYPLFSSRPPSRRHHDFVKRSRSLKARPGEAPSNVRRGPAGSCETGTTEDWRVIAEGNCPTDSSRGFLLLRSASVDAVGAGVADPALRDGADAWVHGQRIVGLDQ